MPARKTPRRRGRGEGSIAQRADGRWEARVDLGWVDGKRRYKSVYGRTRQEVARKLRDVQGHVDRGLPTGEARLTVKGWLEHWVTTILPDTVAPATLDNYANHVRVHLVPAVGHKKLKELTPEDVEALLAAKRTAGLKPNTVRLIRATLRQALTEAQRRELVARNVAGIAKGVKIGKHTEKRSMTVAQARTFLDAIDGDRLEALYLLLLELGVRKGEALGLLWSDVDLDGGTARIVRSLARRSQAGPDGKRVTTLTASSTKTDGSWRTLNLSAPLVRALKVHSRRQKEERLALGEAWKDTGYVFTTKIGTPIDPANMRHAFDAVVERAGLGHWTPHELRHSAASLLLAQGVPLHVVSEVLGHSSISITKDVYGHLIGDETRQASNSIAAALYEPRSTSEGS